MGLDLEMHPAPRRRSAGVLAPPLSISNRYGDFQLKVGWSGRRYTSFPPSCILNQFEMHDDLQLEVRASGGHISPPLSCVHKARWPSIEGR
jgi:hypothetical protein